MSRRPRAFCTAFGPCVYHANGGPCDESCDDETTWSPILLNLVYSMLDALIECTSTALQRTP